MLDVGSLSLEECRAQSKRCEFCCGHGMLKVYHPHYDGRPSRPWRYPDGTVSEKLMTSMAYCVCAAGRKTMLIHQNHAKDVFARITDLYSIQQGASFWVADDPTLPAFDPSEAIEPGDFRARFAECLKKIAKRVKPAPYGSRHSAEREMGIYNPRDSRRAVVPDDYGRHRVPVPVSPQHEEDDVPF